MTAFEFTGATLIRTFCRTSSNKFSIKSIILERFFMIRPIVLSGPSGGGKSTILNRAMKEHPNTFEFSVSHTTRNPRADEIDGQHYHFTDVQTMRKMIENNEFFEYAEFGGNLYGTSKKAVDKIQQSGRICILDVDLQGVRNIKSSSLIAKYILIQPPNIHILEQRLKQRGSETDASIAKRIVRAKQDLKAVEEEPNLFDHVVINDDLERAFNEFLKIIDEEMQMFKKKCKKG